MPETAREKLSDHTESLTRECVTDNNANVGLVLLVTFPFSSFFSFDFFQMPVLPEKGGILYLVTLYPVHTVFKEAWRIIIITLYVVTLIVKSHLIFYLSSRCLTMALLWRWVYIFGLLITVMVYFNRQKSQWDTYSFNHSLSIPVAATHNSICIANGQG